MVTTLESYSSANRNSSMNTNKGNINAAQMRLFECFHHFIVLSANIQNHLFCTNWWILNVNVSKWRYLRVFRWDVRLSVHSSTRILDCKAHRRKRDHQNSRLNEHYWKERSLKYSSPKHFPWSISVIFVSAIIVLIAFIIYIG